MTEIKVEVPKGIEEKLKGVKLEKVIEEALLHEARKRALIKLSDEMMKGAKQLSDEELVRLGRELKKGRYEDLRKKGLV